MRLYQRWMRKNTSKIIIYSPESIYLRNTTIDASIQVAIVSSVIMNSVSDQASELSANILSDAVSGTSKILTEEQASDIQKAMSDGNADAIEAQMTGQTNALKETRKGDSGKMMMVLAILIAVGAAVAFVASQKTGTTSMFGGGCDGQSKELRLAIGVFSLAVKVCFVVFVVKQVIDIFKETSKLINPLEWGT